MLQRCLCAATSAVCLAAIGTARADGQAPAPPVLAADAFKHYVDGFNANDQELYAGSIDDASSWRFLEGNIPLFDCPDKAFEEIYYFRWWTYRKHIKRTPDGFVITEFLPNVSWAGKYNTIDCAAALHLYEGRWLHDGGILDDYSRFWFRGGGSPRSYSFWAADSYWNRFLVTGDTAWLTDLLPDLVRNYKAWEETHLDPNGLFWQIDDRDGMECSIGGNGYRPTINSYQFGDASAITRIAELAGKPGIAAEFRARASRLKELVQQRLWNGQAGFFETLTRLPEMHSVNVRELLGYTPWFMNLPDPGYEGAWGQLMDPMGFFASFGPTTAEQRHPKFAVSYSGHECKWDGPSWPYATSITLTAMANLLNGYHQDVVGRADYFKVLQIYARSQHRTREDGRVVPWIDENLNPYTGDWISRTRLKTWKNGTWDPEVGGKERGKDYNHSTFCDLVISGLMGLRPQADGAVVVNPLVPEGTWDYFCLDNVLYRGRTLTILYDRYGRRYGRGTGLQVLVDGVPVALSQSLGPLRASLAR
jgi:mannosylglycerate hydrolase MGH1-like protein/glycosyl hydrolase family 65